MIPRPTYLARIVEGLESNPVVALLGPRQSGKTTLARMLAEERDCVFFDLEDPADRQRLSAPRLALADRQGLVVIDEIQRMPELFEVLRVLVDRPGSRSRFLVLGSAAPRLVKGAAESLAGRIGFVDLPGFDLSEVGSGKRGDLWQRGRVGGGGRRHPDDVATGIRESADLGERGGGVGGGSRRHRLNAHRRAAADGDPADAHLPRLSALDLAACHGRIGSRMARRWMR